MNKREIIGIIAAIVLAVAPSVNWQAIASGAGKIIANGQDTPATGRAIPEPTGKVRAAVEPLKKLTGDRAILSKAFADFAFVVESSPNDVYKVSGDLEADIVQFGTILASAQNGAVSVPGISEAVDAAADAALGKESQAINKSQAVEFLYAIAWGLD